MQITPFEHETAAADALSSSLKPYLNSPIGIILGTGLGQWIDELHNLLAIDYADIPGFPRSTVQSHLGRLCAGWIEDIPILALQGRFHLYEGYSPDQVCFGLRTLALLGVKKVVVTNAAGALNPLFQTGEIMVISDQINFTGCNPLVGLGYGDPHFPDMSQPFARRLVEMAHATALELGLRLQEGVYISILGPSLETPAETRLFRMLGADAIGMSTVMETIAARQMGLEILGLSCLTNKNLPDCMAATSMDEIVAAGQSTGRSLARLLNKLIPKMA